MSQYHPDNPLIVPGNHTVLVKVDVRGISPRERAGAVRRIDQVAEHIHTYRITPLSIWNACTAGVTPDEIVHALIEYRNTRRPRGGGGDPRLRLALRPPALTHNEDGLVLSAANAPLAEQASRSKRVAPLLVERISPLEFRVDPAERGRLKQALVKIGFPAEDVAGYRAGEPLAIKLRTSTAAGQPFAALRHYQQDAADVFYAGGAARKIGRDRAALRRRQDGRRHGMHGGRPGLDAGTNHQYHGHPAMDFGDSRQNHAARRPGERIQRSGERRAARHCGDL